jgi:exopolysaccharide production protein ExoZ
MRRLIGLQYLRGLAALGVVAYHAADRSGTHFPLGKAGVDLFFVLSGFLMRAITDERSRPGPFLSDRVKRIVPSYWIVTSVMLGGALLGLFPAVRLTVWHVAASYLMLPAISPSNGQVWPLLVPGWTLEYELAFYLLFAAVLLLPRQLQLGTLSAILLGLAITHAWIPGRQTMLHFYTDAHILEFLAGLWLAAGWQRGWLGEARAAYLLAGLAVVLLVAIPAIWPAAPDVVAYGPSAWLIVAAMLARESEDRDVPNIPLARLLGDASYSIYLWHTLAISVTLKLADRLHIPAAMAVPLHFAAGTIIGLLGYRLLERPIMLFFKRPKYRRGAPVPGGV